VSHQKSSIVTVVCETSLGIFVNELVSDPLSKMCEDDPVCLRKFAPRLIRESKEPLEHGGLVVLLAS
jgi:hypothetical protein